MAVRMRVFKVPRFLGKILSGVLGVFGWRSESPK